MELRNIPEDMADKRAENNFPGLDLLGVTRGGDPVAPP
jgi:hypothetical protein